MTTYFDHNDKPGADVRYALLASREARARYLAALAEYDSGDITLYMSKRDIQKRLREAQAMRGVILLRDYQRRAIAHIRNERAAHVAMAARVRS